MLHRRYLNLNTEAIALGLRAGILSLIFSLIYVLYFHENINFILAVIGVFIAALIETTALKSSTIEQIKHGLIISCAGCITMMLGSITAANPLLLSLGMLMFMIPVGLSSSSNPLPATTVLFTCNLFIIGSGLPAPIPQAIVYAGYFCMGGLSLVISSLLQYMCFKNKYDLKLYQILPKCQIFTLNKTNLQFALKLSIAVFAANAIAGYLKFPQQYCAPMTALLILKSDHDSSWERLSHRLFGTLIGSILAIILILLIHDKLFLAILMLPIMFFIVVSMAKHYGAYVFFF